LIPFLTNHQVTDEKFLQFLFKQILPNDHLISESQRLEFLKSIAMLSRFANSKLALDGLPIVYQTLKTHIPLPNEKKATSVTSTTTSTESENENATNEDNTPTVTLPKINFSYVECLLYVFHQFAAKAPKQCYRLCGIYPTSTTENNGQPKEPLSPLSEEVTKEKEEFIKRLTSMEENYKVIEKFKKLSANILTRSQDAPATDKKTLAEKRSSVQIALRTVTNIQKLVASLKSKSPVFLTDKKAVSLSWTSPPSGLGKDDTTDEKSVRRLLRGRGFQRNGQVDVVGERKKVKVLLAGKNRMQLKSKTQPDDDDNKDAMITENPPKRIRTEKKSKRAIYLPPTKRGHEQKEKKEIKSDPANNNVHADTQDVPKTNIIIKRQTKPDNTKKRKGRGEFRKIMH